MKLQRFFQRFVHQKSKSSSEHLLEAKLRPGHAQMKKPGASAGLLVALTPVEISRLVAD
jgi:hypothetical protein